ncbi:MAG: hypothetical protein ACYTXF_37145 [Nostoc sp.]
MTDETSNQEALAKSYEFANCPITFNIQIFPEDDSVEGRQIVIGIRNHQDPPIIKNCRSEDFTCGVIPQLIDELLAELIAELPTRLAAAIERDRVAQIEAMAEVEPDTRRKPKKSKSKASLPTIEVDVVASEVVEAEQTKLNLFG